MSRRSTSWDFIEQSQINLMPWGDFEAMALYRVQYWTLHILGHDRKAVAVAHMYDLL